MNYFQRIFTTKKTVKEEILKPEIITSSDTVTPEPIKANNFVCHHCNHKFEVDTKKLFPMSVPSCDGFYTFQGVGIQCPKCFKDSVFG